MHDTSDSGAPRPISRLWWGGRVLLCIISLQPSPQIILLSYRENGAYDCGDSNR